MLVDTTTRSRERRLCDLTSTSLSTGLSRSRRLFALAWLCAVLTGPARATPLELLLVAPEFAGPYAAAARALTEELARAPAQPVRVTQRTIAQTSLTDLAGSGVVVTLGADALRQALALRAPAPILSLLVPRATYVSLVAAAARAPERDVAGVFLGQPAARQIALVQRVAAGKTRLVILGGANDDAAAQRLAAAARREGLAARHVKVVDEAEIFGVLASSLPEADALLLLPDPKVINARTVRGILLTAYRYQVPVVGYSEYLARAGAVAAVWSPPADMGRQGGVAVRAWIDSGRWPAPAYPAAFEVEVNDTVARSLDLRLLSIPQIKAALQRAETRE